MKLTEALQQLTQFDRQGRSVWAYQDLRKLFPEDNKRAFKAGLQRLVKQGILTRAAKGVYVYALAVTGKTNLLEQLARTLRRGEYNYVSLESALAEYGIISQIPIDRLTIMTTGRKGEYSTPYGILEFTHTQRPLHEVLASRMDVGRPLHLATRKAALRDLRRVGRNIHLIQEEELDED